LRSSVYLHFPGVDAGYEGNSSAQFRCLSFGIHIVGERLQWQQRIPHVGRAPHNTGHIEGSPGWRIIIPHGVY
jgi:hypothetical protein